MRNLSRVYYGWWMVGVAAFVMVIGSVPLFQGLTVWLLVLQRRFGWNWTQLTLSSSFARVEGGVMGPVNGYLIDRLGPRRMVFVGFLILGGGFLFFSRVNSLWEFYLAFLIMGVGAEMGTWLAVMTALNNWFSARRALAMGGAMEGWAIGTAVLVPLLAWSVNPDAFGLDRWRAISFGIGVFIILAASPTALLVRDRPPANGQNPEEQPNGATTAADETRPVGPDAAPEYTLRQALRTRTFWLITAGHGCTSIVVGTFAVHLGPLLDDRGFSLQMVGWVVSTYTGVGAVAILVGGYVGDRLPMRLATFAFSVIQGIAVVVALFAHSIPVVLLLGVLLGIGFGGRVPLTTAIRGVYFGRRSFGSITGTSMLLMTPLILAAPLFAGAMFDITGKYDIPLIVVAVVSLAGAALFLFLGEPRPLSSTNPAAQ